MEEFKIVLAIIFGGLAVIIGIAFMIIAGITLIDGFASLRYWNEEYKVSKTRAKKSKEEYKKLVNQGKIFDSFK